MILVEWIIVRKFIYAGLLLGLGILLLVRARSKRQAVGPWLTAAVLVWVLGGLFAFWGSAIVTGNKALPAVYSPEGRHAARVSIGPFGETAVEMFSAHGLWKDTVYYGDLRSGNGNDLRWASETKLQVHGAKPDGRCISSSRVEVDCVVDQRKPIPFIADQR